jgi:spore coat protein U-like protein
VPTAPNTAFSQFNSVFNATTLGNETVSFGFSIAAGSSPVAAGTYQDTLTLIVSPTI